MRLTDLKKGERIFIDANIFVYHYNAISSECEEFLSRCAKREFQGFTTTSILAETLHRLMIAETLQKGMITGKNPMKKLKEHPEIVRGLSDYLNDVHKIRDMNITILALTEEHLAKSADIRQVEGLLTNDSLLVAAMKHADISALASHDHDFERVAWLRLYAPTDI